jgi:hypothetical protein
MLSAQRPKSMFGMALTQKMTRTAKASTVTISVTLNDKATPATFSATNTIYPRIHQIG